MRQQLRLDLTRAIKARDTVSVAALRSALAVIENAEAVEGAGERSGPTASSAHVAGGAAGLGATEVDRRVLSGTDEKALVRATVDEWAAAAARYDELGRGDVASRVRAEAEVLQRFLGPAV